MRIVVIGGVAAGTKAAAKARRINPAHEILLFQDEAEVSYSACGFPYVISGVIANEQPIIIRRADDFLKDNIQVFTRHRVLGIDKRAQRLTVINLETQVEQSVAYDKLILATGASPIIPKLRGIDLKGILTLRHIDELRCFKDILATRQPKRVVIIGAGYIGLELAESFETLGIACTMIEKSERILPQFDVEMASLVHAHLQEKNVEFILGDGLAEFHGEHGHVTAVITESGRSISADLVVIAIGVKPNVDLAISTGIALGKTGAIAVNSSMETQIPGIFAAGDCCESVYRITGQAVWLPLGDIANLQGRVAGENAAGGRAVFPGVLGTAIFKTFDLAVAITGLSEQQAQTAGFEPFSTVISGTDCARYYPGIQSFTLKLLANRQDGRLLGAQVLGRGNVSKMIDIAATALLGKLTCADLENADLAYSPPFSPVLSPMIIAASILQSQLA